MKAQEKLFCQNYVVHWNGAKAAREAGYSEKRAKVTACDLLKRPEIQDQIALLTASISEKIDVQVEQIVAGLCKIGFAPAEANVLNSDRIRALELLGKWKRMFTERTEHVVQPSGTPMDPKERKEWLEEQLKPLKEAENARPCLAIDSVAVEKRESVNESGSQD